MIFVPSIKRNIFFGLLVSGFITYSMGTCFAQSADSLSAHAKILLSWKDYADAVPLLKRAAEMGQPEAQYNYGYCFESGTFVAQNDSIANVWYLQSALGGWVDAEYKISIRYANGKGIGQDYNEAFRWTKTCAQQGDVSCMWNLITCYKSGLGTDTSMANVITWAEILGRKENPEDLAKSGKITSARLNLALMYLTGDGVRKDTLEGYTWLLLVNEGKNDFSFVMQQDVIAKIKECNLVLTDADKITARHEAERLIGRPLRKLDKLNTVEE